MAPQKPEAPPAPVGRLNAKLGWCAVLVLAAWFYWDSPWQYVRGGYGRIQFGAAQVGYVLIAARAAVACYFHDRSWTWILYAILLVVMGLIVTVITHFVGGG